MRERKIEMAELRRIVDGIHLAVHGKDSRHDFPGGCPDLVIEVQELVRERDPARMVMDLVKERERLRSGIQALVDSLPDWGRSLSSRLTVAEAAANYLRSLLNEGQ